MWGLFCALKWALVRRRRASAGIILSECQVTLLIHPFQQETKFKGSGSLLVMLYKDPASPAIECPLTQLLHDIEINIGPFVVWMWGSDFIPATLETYFLYRYLVNRKWPTSLLIFSWCPNMCILVIRHTLSLKRNAPWKVALLFGKGVDRGTCSAFHFGCAVGYNMQKTWFQNFSLFSCNTQKFEYR